MSTDKGQPGFSPALEGGRLECLRSAYEQKVIEAARRTVRVTTYVLASSVAERRADQELVEAHVRGQGWKLALSSFWDFGQAPPVTDRTGFGEASRYAAQGFAHGIVAIGRQAITTDDATYEELLHFLGSRGVFLAYLPRPDTVRPAPYSRPLSGRVIPAPDHSVFPHGSGTQRRDSSPVPGHNPRVAWHRILSSWKGTDVHGQVSAPVGERRLVLRQGSGKALGLPAARFEELRTAVSRTVKDSFRHTES